MKNLKVRIIKLCALVCLVLPLVRMDVLADGLEAPASGAHGSGSYQLNEVGSDYRFYTEYYVAAATGKSFTTAGIPRRTSIKVYAKKGEIILFGSSVSDSQIDINNNRTGAATKADIVITTPDTISGGSVKIDFDVLKPGEKDKDNNTKPNGQGYIGTPTQEKNGPMVNHTDEGNASQYYVPLTYTVTEDGIYTFEFHSKMGYNDGTSPKAVLAGSDTWDQGANTVAAWDVTVLGMKNATEWEVKEGRAWADYLALTTGNQAAQSDLNVHVLSHDGYLYKVDFKEAAPFGFIFFANNTGFMTTVDNGDGTTSNRPIYHSFYDQSNDLDYMSSKENIVLHKPDDPDTTKEETYKIFFNKPSNDLNSINIKTEPEENVTLSNLQFFGTGSMQNIAHSGHGGNFTFDLVDTDTTVTAEAMITIRLDLRKAILDSGISKEVYDGSGMVEITAPAVEGANTFHWDGKDTEGIIIPPGIYGNQDVILSSEVKRGELHFPVIDMEGLLGGLTVTRLNGTGSGSHDLYFNNNPLAYGTIEGKGYPRVSVVSGYDKLSDGTSSYKISSTKGGSKFFTDPLKISTLKKDTKDYLAGILLGERLPGILYTYADLTPEDKAIIDAEFGKEQDTFHHEAVDSSIASMYFTMDAGNFGGGGNQAGIDAWTYYTSGIQSNKISFAVLDTSGTDRGIIDGQVFYDTNINSTYDSGDKWLPNVKVRLIDAATGKPAVHEENLPCFDESGHFIYNTDGTVKHELKTVKFETVTDLNGKYRFVGVPYTATGTKYYVQVMLTDVQSEVLRYTCTTSEEIKEKLKNGATYFVSGTIAADCGADGNRIVAVSDPTKMYGYKYERDTISNDTIFDAGNTKNIQEVILSSTSPVGVSGLHNVTFKNIGYCTTVPSINQKDYTVKKVWGTDYKGEATHQISDGIIVELYVWNDTHVKEENARQLSRRTGALMDTQVLNAANNWQYTWNNLDDRLQYYVLEYYTKKKPNGEVMYNDKGEPRQVLIGGTMPVFSAATDKTIYGFQTTLGDYPEVEYISGEYRIPIQKFGDGKTHYNAITDVEKLESIDNNARQYNVTYTLTQPDTKTNLISINNAQVFDDRTYYVWLNHETELPEMIAQTYVEAGSNKEKKGHAVALQKDLHYSNGEYSIKGLSVSSVDSANSSNNHEGSATSAFRIKESGTTTALFTATKHGNYTTGTGTRTYRVKYVTNAATKQPVSVTVDGSNRLVTTDTYTAVEGNSAYNVYSWYMTIHVYDVHSDGIIEYDPAGGPVKLQEALNVGQELKWTLTHDGTNHNSVTYTSNDTRTGGILKNDTIRVPLYKDAVDYNMGSCADIVGIAYAGTTAEVDVSKLQFADTFESQYGNDGEEDVYVKDGVAKAVGNGGTVTVDLNTTRLTRINRTQDHANYAEVTFTPKNPDFARATGSDVDVFYYKVVVFAEDNTYQYNTYEDIDALSGVTMYSYFYMKPIGLPDPPLPPEPDPVPPTPDPLPVPPTPDPVPPTPDPVPPIWDPYSIPGPGPGVDRYTDSNAKKMISNLKNRDPRSISPRSGE